MGALRQFSPYIVCRSDASLPVDRQQYCDLTSVLSSWLPAQFGLSEFKWCFAGMASLQVDNSKNNPRL